MTAGSLTAQAVADLVGGRLLGDGAVRIRTRAAAESGRSRRALLCRVRPLRGGARHLPGGCGSGAGRAGRRPGRARGPGSWCPIPTRRWSGSSERSFPRSPQPRASTRPLASAREPAGRRRVHRPVCGAGPERAGRRALPTGAACLARRWRGGGRRHRLGPGRRVLRRQPHR